MAKATTTPPSRRDVLLTSAAGLAALATGSPAKAQLAGEVSKIIFPFGAGGGGDAITRLMAEAVGTDLKRTFIVENRTGADGRIGIQAVKAAAPDGKTYLITTGPTMWLYPMTKTNVGYDPFADFEPVAQIAVFDFCFAVPKDSPLKTMKDVAAWVKANPDKATYALPGAGTIPHFIGVSLAKAFGADMRQLAFRGGAPAIQELVGNQIPLSIGTLADALAQHQAGTIRILATTGKTRSQFTPDVPTLQESGFDIVGDAWYAVFAPKSTPVAETAALGDALRKVLQRPDIKERLLKVGLVATGSSADELTAMMRSNIAIWKPVIEAGGEAMRQ
jgi:tripartite-type tricarboxylate transporter receptor subunit TctC